ncbi:hypothetical protein DBV10_14610 [Acidovorax sp. FJL06]|nr:hypothetical protein DBV10_14610 [Acidovorax sp. FJL06]
MNRLVVMALKCPEAAKFLAMSRATFYDIQNPKSPRFDPTFPTTAKVRLGARSVAWLASDLQAWLESRRVGAQPTGRADQ